MLPAQFNDYDDDDIDYYFTRYKFFISTLTCGFHCDLIDSNNS